MAGVHRPAVNAATRQAVEAVWRIESAHIVSTLARYTGDFALAEDVAQEALAAALVTWPRDGVPASPAGWLLTTGRRRAIDAFRRRSALDERYAALAHEAEATEELDWDPEAIEDDVLTLMFIACHPTLSRESQVALTLRVVGGLSSDEIARGFLVPTATVQARITRAKKALDGVPFEVPPPDERRERLGSVLSVVYLVFTEGSAGSLRVDLAREAVRLARMLARLAPEEAETHGLLALLELTAARFPARLDAAGDPVLLADQDRWRWDRSAILRGRAALAVAQRTGRGLGAYGVQAAIAECHAVAASVDATDWAQVVVLYDALERLAPSPVVTLNRAVAVSMADGPEAALPLVDAVSLPGSHLVPTVRGELLVRLGRAEEARGEFEAAVLLCGNDGERRVLERKLSALATS